jgi:hypothetical protein
MKRVIVFTTVLIILISFSIAILRSLASIQVNPIDTSDLLSHSSKGTGSMWCWVDICPGQTSLGKARELILRYPAKLINDEPNQLEVKISDGSDVSILNHDGSTAPVDVIVIEPREKSLTLAEAVIEFGTPISIEREGEIGYATWHRSICFRFGVCVMIEGVAERIEVQLPIVAITYYHSEDQAYSYTYQPWRGFVSVK